MMIRHEFHKIFVNGKTLLFILMLLVLNVIQLVYAEESSRAWSADAYNEAWEDAKDAYADGGRDAFDEWFEGHVLGILMADTEADREAAAVYTGSAYKEQKLLERIRTEADAAFGYNEYLESVDEAAEKYRLMSVFSEPDGFAYRDIMLMKEAYEKVADKTLVPEASAGIRMATHSDVTDVLAVTLILYLAAAVWLREREQNMLLLIRTTLKGRVRLALSKLAVLMVSCMGVGMLLYGFNMLTAGVVYGLGDLNRPLAAVYEYGHTLWEITAGGFLAVNVMCKILAYVWIMMLMSMICMIAGTAMAAFGGIALTSAAGCMMYYRIPSLSVWATFKYINPFAVLKTELMFEGYKGLDILGHPVLHGYCLVAVFAVGYVIFGLIAVKCFSGYAVKGAVKTKPAVRIMNRIRAVLNGKTGHTCILLHETYRILVCHGTLAVLILFLAFTAYDSRFQEVRYINFKEYYRAYYLNELRGELTDAKTGFVDEEKERVRMLQDSGSEDRLDALGDVEERITYLEENEGAFFIYEAPHERLTSCSPGKVTDYLRAVVCFVVIVLVMPYFFAPGLQTGMYRVTDVTLHGRKKLKVLRYVMGTVLALVIAAAGHLSYFAEAMVSYEVNVEEFMYPVNSLPWLAEFGSGMTIGTYYVVIYVLKIFATVAGAFLVFGISRLVKSPAYTMLAGLMVLVVPLLGVMYDYRIVYAAYPCSAALGNLFVQEKTAAVVCAVTVVSVTAAMYALLHKRRRT